jgi:hypothetical protein
VTSSWVYRLAAMPQPFRNHHSHRFHSGAATTKVCSRLPFYCLWKPWVAGGSFSQSETVVRLACRARSRRRKAVGAEHFDQDAFGLGAAIPFHWT